MKPITNNTVVTIVKEDNYEHFFKKGDTAEVVAFLDAKNYGEDVYILKALETWSGFIGSNGIWSAEEATKLGVAGKCCAVPPSHIQIADGYLDPASTFRLKEDVSLSVKLFGFNKLKRQYAGKSVKVVSLEKITCKKDGESRLTAMVKLAGRDRSYRFAFEDLIEKKKVFVPKLDRTLRKDVGVKCVNDKGGCAVSKGQYYKVINPDYSANSSKGMKLCELQDKDGNKLICSTKRIKVTNDSLEAVKNW